mmetsp:Transcript_19199/g.46080  ORF Transcript_19199/g.46080 Transcript_19199/m.46080 type:complete len:203 (+) Transcript_19199:504-1112(+)
MATLQYLALIGGASITFMIYCRGAQIDPIANMDTPVSAAAVRVHSQQTIVPNNMSCKIHMAYIYHPIESFLQYLSRLSSSSINQSHQFHPVNENVIIQAVRPTPKSYPESTANAVDIISTFVASFRQTERHARIVVPHPILEVSYGVPTPFGTPAIPIVRAYVDAESILRLHAVGIKRKYESDLLDVVEVLQYRNDVVGVNG